MNYETFRETVAQKALERLPCGSSVCMDGIKTFYPDRVDDAVEHVLDETIYFEGAY